MPLKKHNNRKTWACLIAMILVFSSLFTVTAFAYYQNASASVLFAWNKYIQNSYPRITVYERNSSTGADDNKIIYSMNGLNGHYINIDGGYQAVFCLNPNLAAASNCLDGTSSKAERWGKLTPDQQDLVLRALYCGYPNALDSSIQDITGTYPMSAAHAQHLALQAMIFNIRCNYVVKSGSGVAHTKAYNDAENFEERVADMYSNFHTAYDNLFDRMDAFSPSVGIPSFATLSTDTAADSKTILLEPDSSGNYSATVTDTNGVLSYYNFASMNGGGITYSVSGNTLTITATPEAAASLGSATRKGNVQSSAPDVNLSIDNLSFFVGSTANYQTMVELVSSTVTPTYKSVYLMLRAEANGFITVSKKSSDTSITSGNSAYSLAGAEYSIYQTQADAQNKRNAVGVITTDAEGNGQSESLAPGTYYVREAKASLGYQINDEIMTANVGGGVTVDLLSNETPVTKPFTLQKRATTTSFTGSNPAYSLAGAQYGVYASEADANNDANRVETLTTDANGNATSGKKYALGRTLYVKELSASPGYLLDTEVQSITIANSNNNVVSVTEVPTGNSGHFRIRKAADGETITDTAAVFKVEFFTSSDWTGDAAKVWYFKTVNGVCWLDDPAFVDDAQNGSEFFRDAGDNIIFPIGTVKITEQTAPTGYVPTSEVLLAKITQDSSGAAAVWHWTSEAGDVFSYDAEGAAVNNELIRGNLEIIKKDKYEEIYLSGAGFRVYDSDGNQVAEGYTDGHGKLTFKDLVYGEYTYKEFKAPQGFELDETEYSFSITEHGATISHTRVNERRPGTIEVKKQDANGNPFAGVAFLLEFSTDEGSTWQPVFSRDPAEKNITRGGCTSPGLTDGQLVTDDTGQVRFTGLRADCKILYRLTETAAPEGYALMAGSLYVGTLPIRTENIYASDAEVFGTYAYVYSLYVTATNDPVFRMPETGAPGFGYLPLAMLLCAAPITIITKNNKRKGDFTA